jgi:hypothetical protein
MQGAKTLDSCRYGLLPIGFTGNIAVDKYGLATVAFNFAGHLLAFGLQDITQHNAGALLGKAARNGGANTTCGATHQRYFSCQSHRATPVYGCRQPVLNLSQEDGATAGLPLYALLLFGQLPLGKWHDPTRYFMLS